jgi:hypothetical protein
MTESENMAIFDAMALALVPRETGRGNSASPL